ncbi:MAG: Cell shape-determining protein MreC [Thermodesulfobacteriota bacterium]|nr:Cell shape-determining protein MreC [Thermodesulfobacteriota bacterium]
MQGDKRFRNLWISIFFVCFVLFLLSSSSGLKQPWNAVEQLIVEITAPFQQLIRQTINATKEFWTNYFYLVDVRSENKRLKREIDSFRRENSQYSELLATHERLRSLLQFKEVIHRPVVAAQVIGLDPTGWFKSIIIDKGKTAGIRWDMPVVNASGVVGRIVSVSNNYAKVLLIIDQNSAVDCLTQRSRDRGMVKGTSGQVCKMDYMAKSSDAVVGDLVITSGLGGVFPKGLPVGRISSVKEGDDKLFKDIDMAPSVDFSKLEEVLVIQTTDPKGKEE